MIEDDRGPDPEQPAFSIDLSSIPGTRPDLSDREKAKRRAKNKAARKARRR